MTVEVVVVVDTLVLVIVSVLVVVEDLNLMDINLVLREVGSGGS